MDFFFMFFSLLIVLSSLGVMLFENAIYALVSLLFVFFGVTGFFLLLGADFVAVAQIFVALAGIIILFLFSIVISRSTYNIRWKMPLQLKGFAVAISVLFFVCLIYIIKSIPWEVSLDLLAPRPTTARIGDLLLTEFVFPFHLVGVFIVVAIVGSVLFLRSEKGAE
ncbi:NADH-quinone oxidoreductase subunit J [Bdellovibrionota bacterium]